MSRSHRTPSLEAKRHSLAHLLAWAVREEFPSVQLAIGPAIEDGFYYDMRLPKPITAEHLKRFEHRMRDAIRNDIPFTHTQISKAKARTLFVKQPFKRELIKELKGRTVGLSTVGPFGDLCRGGHVRKTGDIAPDAFRLDRIAGAYWRGDEENPMLTRIYGLAFHTKEELAAYDTMIEEAKKRDHKVLGPALDLFTFSPLVGSGLPLWTPRGTVLRIVLDAYVWELRRAQGYERVEIPHLAKKDLYETSGHWDKFQDELFRTKTREGHEFVLKPMNCPHHTQIFARKSWSYREMPQRYANTTMVYRDEQSGELNGLSRVRSITQDDAHVFCRASHVAEEMERVWNIIETFYGTVGFELSARLSLHDPKHKAQYLGSPKRWAEAERALRALVKKKGVRAIEAKGEAAFYGPKIDFITKDSLGREWQLATIQLDMNQPERFDLSCVNEKGKTERIVMIHAAIMGAIERYLSILIEHFAGAFPLWLAPVQVSLATVNNRMGAYARSVQYALEEQGLRVHLDDREETIGKKIRESEQAKVPVLLVVGPREEQEHTVSLRYRGGVDGGSMSIEKVVALLARARDLRQLALP